jgi:hypothetical protein
VVQSEAILLQCPDRAILTSSRRLFHSKKERPDIQVVIGSAARAAPP